jgi:uncharacterized protein (DUF983 family)
VRSDTTRAMLVVVVVAVLVVKEVLLVELVLELEP